MDDIEHILESITVRFPWVDKGLSSDTFFLTSLEVSDGGLVLPTARRATKRELLLGTVGAFLLHVVAAAILLLLPFFQPQRHTYEPFVNVYFADIGRNGCDSSAAGPAGGAEAGKQPEQFAPEVKSGEKEVVHDVPKTVGPTILPAKDRKKVSTNSKAVQALPPKSPLADSSKILTANNDHASENSGADLGRGQAEGTGNGKDAGEGSGSPGPGGLSFGTGPPGEFDATTVDKVPQILKKIEPVYPQRARSLGICGKVVVRFLVETDGHVSKPSIVEAHPKGYFEQSTLEAICHWRFKPGCFKGKDVATWVILPVQFQLTGQD